MRQLALSLLCATALSLTAFSAHSAEDNKLVILPPDYDYRKICKPVTRLDKDIDATKLRGEKFEDIRLSDLVQLLKLYHRGSGAVAPDYGYAIRIIDYLETVPRDEDNARYLDEALFVKYDMLYKGKGYAQNTNAAKAVLDELITKKSTKAYNRYGDILLAEKRYDDAVAYYKKAIIAGEISSYYALAKIYYDKNVEVSQQEIDAAIVNAQNATLEYIARGNCQSLNSLGLMYEYMKGLPNAETYSVKWYEKAAQIDDPRAKLKLAQLMQRGFGVENASMDDVVTLWRQAAALGSERAMFYLGEFYLLNQNRADLALPWLEKAADYRHLESMELLARIYEGGQPGVEGDVKKRLYWLEKAAAHDRVKLTTIDQLIAMLELHTNAPPERLFALYERAASMGSDDALIKIGNMIRYGIGRNAEPTRALRYYRLAASNGKTVAMRQLVKGYECEIGKAYDANKIDSWYKQIAYFSEETKLEEAYNAIRTSAKDIDQHVETLRFLITTRKSEQAMVALGSYYLKNDDEDKAEEWFKQALESDRVKDETYKAHFYLGRLYTEGDIIPQNMTKGLKLLQIAADAGNDSAYNKLGDIYKETGKPDKALYNYAQAARYGKTSAYKQMYKIYSQSGKPEEAVKMLEKAAKAQEVSAMLELAKGYGSDDWIVPQDDEKARYWFEQTVSHYPCEAEDIYDIAESYMEGKNGAPKDTAKAEKWLASIRSTSTISDEDALSLAKMVLTSDLARDEKRAEDAMNTLTRLAKQNNTDALTLLSDISLSRLNAGSSKQDVEQAIGWLERSANQGNVEAMMNLANLYLSGHVVDVSKDKAIIWLNKAAESGSSVAKARLKVIH